MALIRPVVLVYQEFANPSITPTSPDLNCLIVGPAHYIQDYFTPGTTTPADKTSIALATDYGQLEAPPATLPPGGGTAAITVAQPPNNVVGALLDQDSVAIYFDQARVVIASGTHGNATAGSNDFTTSGGDATTFATTGVGQALPGDRVIMSDGTNTLARTVYAVDGNAELTLSADMPATGFTFSANAIQWRLERQLSDQLINSSFVIPSGNSVVVNGGVTLKANGVAKTVSYAKVYMAYTSMRLDLQNLDTVGSEDDITAKIGRVDGRNPLAVGAFVALQNTTTPVQFFGIASDDLAGHIACRDAISSRDDVYAIVPLTQDVPIISMWNTDNVALELPDETKGRPQRFRAVLGSGTLPQTAILEQPSSTGTTATLSGSGGGAIKQFTIPGKDLIALGVLPGDKITVTADAATTVRNGVFTVAQVDSATVVEVDEVIVAAESGNATVSIDSADGTTHKLTPTAITALASAALNDLYLSLQDPNGTFITSGIQPGDLVQFPQNPTSSSFTGSLDSFVVAGVDSENRLRIANNGSNTSTVENELPHGVTRVAPPTLISGGATIYYQIARPLSKDEQVTQLVALSQSFLSRRTVLIWPDKVDVADVVDGTAQPGYYVACAVGGMTAGLPPHQGFTFLGIAGISRIYNSNTYFSDQQLTDLMQGGWYVFAQQTPTSLPFTIHQLTTDPTTLETGEFSVVKNFDYVSLYFIDILQNFLGRYNITPESITFVRNAMQTGGQTLMLRSFAKIGAPLTSFLLTSIGVSAVSADRLVAMATIGLPKPLNVIELHLVA
jgi:hypothetical protein